MKNYKKIFFILLVAMGIFAVGACSCGTTTTTTTTTTQAPTTTTTTTQSTTTTTTTTQSSTTTTTQAPVVATALELSGETTQFFLGDEFSYEGLQVKVVYSNEEKEAITEYSVDSSKYNKAQVGEYSISVSATIEGVTVSKSYKVYVVDTISEVALDYSQVETNVEVGDAFDFSKLVFTATLLDGSTKTLEGYDVTVTYGDNTVESYTEQGEYLVTVNYCGYEQTFTVEATHGGYYIVDSVEDYIYMRAYQVKDGDNLVNNKKWKLGADLDFTGVVLEDLSDTLYFTGEFDGQGHKLSNIYYAAGGAKRSPLFQYVDGGTIKNVTFFGCTATSASESIALVCGQSKDATISNIEFSCCNVISTSSSGYAALIIGRHQKGTANISNITVKNLTSVKGIKYTGVLVGDTAEKSKAIFTNCDVNASVGSGSQYGVFLGRARKDVELTIESSVVRLEIVANGSSSNKFGVFADGCAAAKINVKDTVIVSCTSNEIALTQSDLLLGQEKATVALENVYYVADSSVPVKGATGATAKEAADITYSFLKETVKLSEEVWEEDSRFGAKLKSASSNTPGQDAVVSKLQLISNNCKTQYFEGQEFSYANLIVVGIYSDGVVISLEENQYTVKVTDSNNAEVTDFTAAKVGTYNVVVTAGEVSEKYTVDVVKYVDITVKTDDVRLVYQVGEKLDLSSLVVFLEISDGTHVLAGASDYTVTWGEDKAASVALTKGTHTVKVSKGEFVKEFKVTVVEVTEDEVVEVYVDASKADGELAEGDIYFTTVEKAINYLESLNLDEETYKVVYIAEGKYYEKLTISLPNVKLVGADEDYNKVVIYYDAASDTKVVNESQTYGTEKSATVIVSKSAVGFTAQNIYFQNTFDYHASTFANKQALALFSQADQSVFVNCGFSGVQDTLEAKEGRQYYYGCYIEGAVDFIFGNNAPVVFENCTIHNVPRLKSDGTPESNQGYVVATKGFSSGADYDGVTYNYVFLGCKFTADSRVPEGSVSIARPWGANSSVAVINCELGAHFSKAGYDGSVKSRYDQMSGNLPQDARFVEYGNTGDGAISTAVTGVTILSQGEAAQYTVENVFAATNGKLTWDSAWVMNSEVIETGYYDVIGLETTYTTDATQIVVPTVVFVRMDSVEILEVTVDKVLDKNNAEVTVEDALATVGTYKVSLKEGNSIVYEYEIKVAKSSLVDVTYFFDANDLTGNVVPEAATDITSNTVINEFFTIKATSDKKVTVEKNAQSYGDLSFDTRMKLNGTGSADYRNITFTLEYAATINVYAYTGSNSDLTRTVDLFKADGTKVDSFVLNEAKLFEVTFNVEAGEYYITCAGKAVNIYGMEVLTKKMGAAQTVEKTYVLNANDLTVGDITTNTTFADFFILNASSSNKFTVDGNKKTGGEYSFTQRIKYNGKTGATVADRTIQFTTKGSAVVTIYVLSSSSSDATRTVDLCNESLTVLQSAFAPTKEGDNGLVPVVFEIEEAGTYYLAALVNGVNIYGIEVTVQEPAA